jgi:hypothetical protein
MSVGQGNNEVTDETKPVARETDAYSARGCPSAAGGAL